MALISSSTPFNPITTIIPDVTANFSSNETYVGFDLPEASETEPLNTADAKFDKNIRILMLAILMVLGAVGGILVCIWLWYNRRRKSRVNTLIFHVTMSDIFVLCFATITQLVWECVDRHWMAGPVMCKIIKYLQSISLMASNNMLVILSFDRHQAIRSPLREPFGVWKMASVGWLIAGVLSLPQFYLFHETYRHNGTFANRTVCEAKFRDLPHSHRTAYLTFINVVVFYIPLLLISAFYVRIFLKISSKVKESTSSTKKQSTKKGAVHLQSTSSSTLPKAKIKTLKMTIIIVVTFVVCTAPLQILEILYNFYHHSMVSPIAAAILGSMAVANSSINPFVFIFFNANLNCIRGLCKKADQRRTYDPMTGSRTEYTMATTHSELTRNSRYSDNVELTGGHRAKATMEKGVRDRGAYAPVART